jgi:hypothetical protein
MNKLYTVDKDLNLVRYHYPMFIKIVIGLSIVLGLILIVSARPASKIVVTQHDTIYVEKIVLDTTPLTRENLYKEIIKEGIAFPEVVMRQAMGETGYLTSDICKENHNCFGFKVFPNYDFSYAVGIKRGHLAFKHWKDSVKEYKRFQKRNFEAKHDIYYGFLKNQGYAESSTYIPFLKGLKIK